MGNISYTHFIRTTDSSHKNLVQILWVIMEVIIIKYSWFVESVVGVRIYL